jgi:hypothetical protein
MGGGGEVGIDVYVLGEVLPCAELARRNPLALGVVAEEVDVGDLLCGDMVEGEMR